MSPLAGALLLGVIQGLTEFLPVSSSGHLVIGQVVLALHQPSLLLDILLHVGTLLPVLWLYRREVGQMLGALPKLPSPRQHWDKDQGLRLLVAVAVGTVPTALIGVLLNDLFEQLFSSALAVGIALLITGGLLLVTYWRPGPPVEGDRGFRTLTPAKALLVGIAQGGAITPGISRSGTTIAVALLLGVERATAARFSFLLSLPAIAGAVALHLRKAEIAAGQLPAFALGAIAAALSGYLALRWVVAFVKQGRMHWFTLYVWPLGLAVLLYALTR